MPNEVIQNSESTAPQRRLGLVVEDQPKVRTWLGEVLAETFSDLVIASAGSLRTARAALAAASAPEAPPLAIALVDLGLPDGSGVEFIGELAAKLPEAVPVVTTVYDDDAHLFEALAAGARGYLLKDGEPEGIKRALRGIERGEPALSPAIAHRILAHFRMPAIAGRKTDASGLTARETEVLTLLGRGLTVPEAARRLGLTDHTVAGYVKIIYQKLNVSRRAEATLEAHRRGLV
jgi:DNA-binding NarL/FixJ family response regulator